MTRTMKMDELAEKDLIQPLMTVKVNFSCCDLALSVCREVLKGIFTQMTDKYGCRVRVAFIGCDEDEDKMQTLKFVEDPDEFVSIVATQITANSLAKKFNQIKPKEAKSIHFLNVQLVTAEDSDGFPSLHTANIFPNSAKITKFNSTFGHTPNKSDFTSSTLNAFSHWTCDYANLLVVDLQGIFHKDEFFLADPSIHCNAPGFGTANMGRAGAQAFFETHECNHLCKLMGLKSNKYMKGSPN